MFERKIYSEMLHWKEAFAPKYALFLKGARRVGKTTLAEKLGREAYDSYILIQRAVKPRHSWRGFTAHRSKMDYFHRSRNALLFTIMQCKYAI